MTQEAQRTAIAEACGWEDVCHEEGKDVDFEARSVCPWEGLRGLINGGRFFVPDYLNDLNAMHEAEKELTGVQADEYADALFIITYDALKGDRHWATNKFFAVHATAAQRCEAFLRTIGKWKD